MRKPLRISSSISEVHIRTFRLQLSKLAASTDALLRTTLAEMLMQSPLVGSRRSITLRIVQSLVRMRHDQ